MEEASQEGACTCGDDFFFFFKKDGLKPSHKQTHLVSFKRAWTSTSGGTRCPRAPTSPEEPPLSASMKRSRCPPTSLLLLEVRSDLKLSRPGGCFSSSPSSSPTRRPRTEPSTECWATRRAVRRWWVGAKVTRAVVLTTSGGAQVCWPRCFVRWPRLAAQPASTTS